MRNKEEEWKRARRAYQKDWREKHKKELREYYREWRQRNKDKLRIYTQRYWQKKAELQEAEQQGEIEGKEGIKK